MSINFNTALCIIFEVSLFGLLITLVVQLLYGQLLPYIHQQIQATKTKWQDLFEKLNLTITTRQSVEEKIKEQNKQLKKLKKKIVIWHNARRIILKEQERAQEKIKVSLIKKKERQQQYMHLFKLKEETIPQAIALAHEELAKQYAGTHGKEAVSAIIRKIEEQALAHTRSKKV